MPSGKALNNDWRAETTRYGERFTVRLSTEGNEAEGEIPHVNAAQAVDARLHADGSEFAPGDVPDSPEGAETPQSEAVNFSTSGVDMEMELSGSSELISEELSELAERVEESLPEEWERTE